MTYLTICLSRREGSVDAVVRIKTLGFEEEKSAARTA